MTGLFQALAWGYEEVEPEVKVQLVETRSKVGFTRLIAGRCDMAGARREMEEQELERFKQSYPGQEPGQHLVGHDALAIFVHQSNPIETISIPELAAIYRATGDVTRWSQLRAGNSICVDGEINRVSRSNGSNSLEQFRKAVMASGDKFKAGSIDQDSGADVVALIAQRRCAIGYSSMQYKTADVKWLKISRNKGETGVAPDAASLRAGSYPIANPLLICTIGSPVGNVKRFLDWVKSPGGQIIVNRVGFVSVGE